MGWRQPLSTLLPGSAGASKAAASLTQGTWTAASPGTRGRAGALWVLKDDKGGPSLSILLRALLIEPFAAAAAALRPWPVKPATS